jgi:aldose 1-epimerase
MQAWRGAPAATLRRGGLELTMLPDRGACIAGLTHHREGQAALPLLRPLPPDSGDPFQSGGHVMLPYANRLHAQRLWDSPDVHSIRARRIACNRSGIADPVHGVGWMKRWTVLHRGPDTLTLGYVHAADAHWPYAHRACLRATVQDDAVLFRLALTNQEDVPMPFGMGFHPYLTIDPDSRLRVDAARSWEQDGQGRPTRLIPWPAQAGDGIAASALQINHCLAGWCGPVRLLHPGRGLVLEIHAEEDLQHLQLYRPAGVPWLCVEPMSQATGVWSLRQVRRQEAGERWLPPGATWETGIRLRVRPLAG